MAGKKPAKPIAGQNRDKEPKLPGKAVMYVGSKNAVAFCCPTCNRTFNRGIFFEENSIGYCTRRCIPKEAA